MKKPVLISLFVFITLIGCENLDIEPGVPECIVKKTKNFNKQVCETGGSVEEYKFQNKTVYVFYIGPCGYDTASEVIDSDCNTMGHLGGFTGNTKVNEVEFSSNATFVRTVWKN